MNILGLFCTITAVFVMASPASGQMYQYTDKHGNVVFSDRPPAGSDAKEKQLKDNVYYSAPERREERHSRRNAPPSQGESEEQLRREPDYSRVDVILYKTSWCAPCKRAEAYILSLGANLTSYDIEKDKDKRDEMKKKSGGYSGVPLIDIEGTILRGFSEAAVKAELDKHATR